MSELILRSVKGSKLTIAEMDANLEHLNEPQHNTSWISNIDDFPTAVAGVITLETGITYFIMDDIDLAGNRIVCNGVVNLFGFSSETCKLTSTGLATGTYLITTEFTIVMRDMTIYNVGSCFDINGQGINTVALDWNGLNFNSINNIGSFQNITNFIFNKGSIINSGGLTFNGTIDTLSFSNSIFTGTGAGIKIIELLSGLVIARRFRIIYSAFIVFGGDIGIDFDGGVTVPDEAFIFDTMNFAGGGNYINGIESSSVKALWSNNAGIDNSLELGYYTLSGNVTPTNVAIVDVPVKVEGITVSESLTQKFTCTNNRATYIGGLKRVFNVTAVLSAISGNNNQIGTYIAKNGVILENSEIYATTTGVGRAESIKIQCVIDMVNDDYIEVWIENKTALIPITVQDMSVIVKSLN